VRGGGRRGIREYTAEMKEERRGVLR
jgi:hypothetical protein